MGDRDLDSEPAPRARVSPAVVAIAVAVLVVACGSVAIGLWAASLGSPGTDDTVSAEPATTAPPATGTPATTAAPVTSSPDPATATSGPTTTLLYRMQMATDPGGTFQLRIPQHWTEVDMTGDHAAEATATFPDDPVLATKLATLMDALGSPQSRMNASYWTDRMPQGRELADVLMASFERL